MRLDAKDVNISISGKPIVQHLSIEVPDRKFSALLGANGSGKTTLMKTWAGALFPVSGRVDVFGSHPADRKADFLASAVYMPDEISFPQLSVAAFERVYGRFRPHFSHEDFGSYLNALDFSFGVRIDRLSTGNRKKLFIAFSLASNPALLLMDEPTNGLDIESKKAFRRTTWSHMTRAMEHPFTATAGFTHIAAATPSASPTSTISTCAWSTLCATAAPRVRSV